MRAGFSRRSCLEKRSSRRFPDSKSIENSRLSPGAAAWNTTVLCPSEGLPRRPRALAWVSARTAAGFVNESARSCSLPLGSATRKTSQRSDTASFSAPGIVSWKAGSSVSAAATVTVSPFRHAIYGPPTAGSVPGSLMRWPLRSRKPPTPGSFQTRSVSPATGSPAGGAIGPAACAPAAASTTISDAAARTRTSALHLRVVVHDAEDVTAVVAVAGQGRVAVDPPAHIAAAVDEPANTAAATAVPRSVEVRAEAEVFRRDAADPRPGRRRERVAVRVAQQVALRIDRPAA